MTNMRELAPPMPFIPDMLLVQSTTVEYVKEYIVVEPIDSSSAGLRAINVGDIVQLRNRFNGRLLASENNERLTYLDLPHTKFTATRWLRSVKMLSM